MKCSFASFHGNYKDKIKYIYIVKQVLINSKLHH